MPSRELFVRHLPASLAVAAVVAGSLTLVVATQPTPPQTELKASVTECHDMVTVSVAGRRDTPVAGTTKMLVGTRGEPLPAALSGDHRSHWVDPVINAPADDVRPGSYAAVYIAYPANLATYEDAVNTGVTNTQQVMREIASACPNTRFSIVGYSEGADVARRVAMNIGHQSGIVDPTKVVGVVILADAGRAAGDGPFPGARDPFGRPDNFDQRYQNGGVPVPGQGALPGTAGDFGALNGKVASFCSDGDLTCAAPQNISLLNLVVNVGRQLNVDALERDGLTPATGQDVAVVLSRIALAAFADIGAQPNWMASDETFLQVLLRVSDPAYRPGQARPAPPRTEAISTTDMSPLAYLPQKVLNEIVGLIATNQNTIPVILNDPYQQTLGPNGTGHHFDYWRDANPANGKPLTSSEYAAAWLTHLAKQAQAGQPLNTTTPPPTAALVAAYREVHATLTSTTTTPTTRPTTTTTTTTNPPTTTRPTTTAPRSTTTTTTTTRPTTSTTPTTTRRTTTTTTPPSSAPTTPALP